jgi:hypothetical protein
MLVVLFTGCNSKPVVATPAPTQSSTPKAAATPTPTLTLRPIEPAPATDTPPNTDFPENMHSFGEIRDESGKVVAKAMALVIEHGEENNDLRIVVRKFSKERVYVDFNCGSQYLYERNNKLHIAKVKGGGHLIIAVTGSGHLEQILVAYYDGTTLKKVDFSFDEYFSADVKDVGERLFSLKWGKGNKFTITPKGGEPVEFTVNEELYNEWAYDHTFEDFDKEAEITSVINWTAYHYVEWGTGNLVMGAVLTFDGGQGGGFAQAKITFAFDVKTTAFTIKNIEYELKD